MNGHVLIASVVLCTSQTCNAVRHFARTVQHARQCLTRAPREASVVSLTASVQTHSRACSVSITSAVTTTRDAAMWPSTAMTRSTTPDWAAYFSATSQTQCCSIRTWTTTSANSCSSIQNNSFGTATTGCRCAHSRFIITTRANGHGSVVSPQVNNSACLYVLGCRGDFPFVITEKPVGIPIEFPIPYPHNWKTLCLFF